MSNRSRSGKQNTRRPVKRYRKGVIVAVNTLLCVIMAVCVLGTTAFAALLYWDFSDSGNAQADLDQIAQSQSQDVTYFLVAGVDEGGSANEGGGLTDIVMVVCFDHKAGSASVLQIPRDTFIGVDVPTSKMNAVYGQAPREEGQTSINVLLRRINDYFGLPVDHYITVTLSAFRGIVDAVGGVDVYVPSNINNAFNENRERYTFYEGMNHMDGGAAEAFVRHRKSYVMGDLGRVQAQRNFYAAFIKKCLDMNYSQMVSAATAMYDKMTTDMKLVDMLAYAKEAQALTVADIRFLALPGQGGTFSVQGRQALSYYSVHKQEYVDMVNEYLLPYSDPITVDDLRIQELHSTYYENYIEDYSDISEYLHERTEEE